MQLIRIKYVSLPSIFSYKFYVPPRAYLAAIGYVRVTCLPSSYWLRARYVPTDLVTSQNFQPIRCAFALFHFGRPRAVYVPPDSFLLSSTAEGSATSGT